MLKSKRIAYIAIISIFIFATGCTSRKIDKSEKNLLVDIKDIETHLNLSSFQAAFCGQYSAKNFLTGTMEIDYDFDSRKNAANNKGVLIIKSIINTCPSISVADNSFKQRLKGYKLGLSLSNKEVGLLEDSSLFTGGDENYCAYLTVRGEKMGNFVMTRKRNIIYSFMVIGLYIDDKDVLADLLKPKLERAADYYKK